MSNPPDIENNEKKSVDDIFAEIDQIEVDKIELNPDTVKYFETIEGYLKCFDELEALYNEVDPSHKLASYDMPDIKHPIQQRSMRGEPIKNLAELYEVAEGTLTVFTAKVEDLLTRMATSNPYADESSDPIFKLPPGENKLKGRQRASEKAQDDYSKVAPGPPESWLYDIVRGSMLFDNADQILNFLELIRADESIEIVKSKNRFRNPTLSGYRDWNLQLRISTEDGSIKHICELQLHLKPIKEAAVRLGSHGYYEFFRKYYAGATVALEERMNDLRVLCEGGSLNITFLANVVKNPLDADLMLRLSYLFQHQVNDYQLAMMITNAIRESLEKNVLFTRMGKLFWQQGILEEALTMHQNALDIRLKTHGPHHIDTAGSYNNMALVLQTQGKLEEALTMHQKALDILKALGPAHVDSTATSYNNMAVVLQNQGKLGEALMMHQNTLEARLKAYGPDHIYTAASYNNIAAVLREQGKLEEALTMHRKALKTRLNALGPHHIDTASSYNNMANILQNQGNSEEALSMHQKALDIRLKALGRDHIDTASSYNNMASILNNQGKLKEAVTMHQEALDIRLKALGPNHADTASSYYNMANVRQTQGKLEQSLSLHQKALQIRLQALGPDHVDTASSYNNMAVVLEKQGKLEEALTMHRKLLGIRLKAIGPDHTGTATSYNNLANALEKQGKLTGALMMHRKALAIRLQALGPDHTDTATSYYCMAVILQNQGKLEDASINGQLALENFLKVLGPDHAYTGYCLDLVKSINGLLKKKREEESPSQVL